MKKEEKNNSRNKNSINSNKDTFLKNKNKHNLSIKKNIINKTYDKFDDDIDDSKFIKSSNIIMNNKNIHENGKKNSITIYDSMKFKIQKKEIQ